MQKIPCALAQGIFHIRYSVGGVTGAATVIKAMGAGKAAAKAIDEYIQSK